MAAFSAAGSVRAQDIIVYTENYPPFNFQQEDGQIGGVATDRVRQVLDQTGLDYEIRLVPWARAIKFARSRPNALIYTLTRTPKRELNYDWLVPISESNFYIFVRHDETREVTLEALRAGVFTASCVSGDLACELLTWTGMPEKNIIPITNAGTGDFRMVVAGRADIYVSDINANARLRKQEGFDPNLTKPVMRLRGKAGFYLASGLQVSADIREKVRQAYKALSAKGLYKLVDTEELKN